MGGEIIAENNGGNDYNVLLTIYRDTIGIPTDINQDFSVFDDSGNNIMNFSMTMDLSANHPIFGFQNGSLQRTILKSKYWMIGTKIHSH